MAKTLITNIDRASGRIVPSAMDHDVASSSERLGWHHLTAEHHRIPPAHQPEHFVRTHRLMVHLGGPARFEYRDGGTMWHARSLHAGDTSMLADGMANEPRWHDPLDMLAIGVDSAFVANCFSDAVPAANIGFEPVRGRADPVIRKFSALILAELAYPVSRGELFGDALALALARHLVGQYGAGIVEPRGTLTGRQLGRVLDYVRADLTADIGLEDMAAQAAISPFHFARLFRAAVGVSPHQFVLRLRIETAQALIRTGKARSLTELALDTGFFDQAHFTRSFKRFTGTTPSAFAAKFDL